MTGLSDAHVRFWFAEKFGDRLSGDWEVAEFS